MFSFRKRAHIWNILIFECARAFLLEKLLFSQIFNISGLFFFSASPLGFSLPVSNPFLSTRNMAWCTTRNCPRNVLHFNILTVYSTFSVFLYYSPDFIFFHLYLSVVVFHDIPCGFTPRYYTWGLFNECASLRPREWQRNLKTTADKCVTAPRVSFFFFLDWIFIMQVRYPPGLISRLFFSFISFPVLCRHAGSTIYPLTLL